MRSSWKNRAGVSVGSLLSSSAPQASVNDAASEYAVDCAVSAMRGNGDSAAQSPRHASSTCSSSQPAGKRPKIAQSSSSTTVSSALLMAASAERDRDHAKSGQSWSPVWTGSMVMASGFDPPPSARASLDRASTAYINASRTGSSDSSGRASVQGRRNGHGHSASNEVAAGRDHIRGIRHAFRPARRGDAARATAAEAADAAEAVESTTTTAAAAAAATQTAASKRAPPARSVSAAAAAVTEHGAASSPLQHSDSAGSDNSSGAADRRATSEPTTAQDHRSSIVVIRRTTNGKKRRFVNDLTVEPQPRAAANGVKMCTHCGQTKTPLWREGPFGKSTLCNACGVYYVAHGTLVGRTREAAPVRTLTRKPRNLAPTRQSARGSTQTAAAAAYRDRDNSESSSDRPSDDDAY